MKKSTLFKGLGIILSLLFFVFSSCKKNEESPQPPTMVITMNNGDALPDKLDVSADGEDIAFTVTASDNKWSYSINNGDNWLTEKDKTNNSLVLSVLKNNNGVRTATLVFKLPNSSSTITQEVEITQEKFEKKDTIPEDTVPSPPAVEDVADVLDVLFNSDGTAKDTSPVKMTIQTISHDHPITINYNENLGRNVAYFSPKEGNGYTVLNGEGSYYRIDYANNNDFKSKLTDGYSIECLVKFDHDYTSSPASYETMFFSTIGGGGTGVYVSKKVKDHVNVLTFLTNVGSTEGKSNYINTYSEIVPDNNTWYHLVGVWNRSTGDIKFYINGETAATSQAPTNGFLNFATGTSEWWGIGGDAGPNGIQQGIKGSIAIARIFDDALTDSEVQELWSQVKDLIK